MNIILIIPLLLFSKFTIASGENEHSIQEINEALSISETTTPSVPQLNQPSA